MLRNQSAVCLFAITWIAAASFGGTTTLAVASDLPISIEGCPSKLSLYAPSEFSTANGENQKALRLSTLNGLHANPSSKIHYSEILLTNWDNTSGIPQILVGSLGTTRQLQGNMSESQWQDFKNTAITSTKTQQTEWIQKGLAQLKPGKSNNFQKIEGEIIRIGQGGQNDFIMFGNSKSSVAEKPLYLYTATKFIYVKECLAYIIVSVEVSDKDALDKLTKIVEQVSVR